MSSTFPVSQVAQAESVEAVEQLAKLSALVLQYKLSLVNICSVFTVKTKTFLHFKHVTISP